MKNYLFIFKNLITSIHNMTTPTTKMEDVNPFPPDTSAHMNYDSGMGFPPIEAAPSLWSIRRMNPPKNIVSAWPELFNDFPFMK